MMEGIVEIPAFVSYLEKNNLVIAPRTLVEERLQEREREAFRKKCLAKKALTYSEISKAGLWGNIQPKAVKVKAEKYAKENEIFFSPKGKLKQYKIITAAVQRIAIQCGIIS